MVHRTCTDPLSFGGIHRISPSGHTAWTEVDVQSADGCYYRMDIADLSNVVWTVIDRARKAEDKGRGVTEKDVEEIIGVKMTVEKTPRQRYAHLKFDFDPEG